MAITHCPVCQCKIIVNDIQTKSHETYADCLEALILEFTNKLSDLTYLFKRIISVMRLEVKKRAELQKQLDKVYEVDG